MLRTFALKTLIFLLLPTAVLLAITLLVPPTPRVATSLLFAKLDKDTLLRDTPSPRLILVGGSNLSFGINSQLFKDELKLNPVNTAIHASLGLKYMMDSSIGYVRPGDVVILVPEYSQYFGDRAYGSEELLRTVIDVDRASLFTLSLRQWSNIAQYLPKLALSKLRPSDYSFQQSAEPGVYERRSFNQYGDAYIHWNLPSEPFAAYEPSANPFNDEVVAEITAFQRQVSERGAVLYISFPGLQASSYENLKAQIGEVESRLRASGLVLLGAPENYKIPDEYMFNTPYHLTRQGVDLRTRQLIADLRNH